MCLPAWNAEMIGLCPLVDYGHVPSILMVLLHLSVTITPFPSLLFLQSIDMAA